MSCALVVKYDVAFCATGVCHKTQLAPAQLYLIAIHALRLEVPPSLSVFRRTLLDLDLRSRPPMRSRLLNQFRYYSAQLVAY